MDKKKKIIIGIVAAVLVLAVGIGVYANSKLSKVKKTELNKENLKVEEKDDKDEKKEEPQEEKGYLNVALFGVNNTSAKSKDVDSDVVYVVSLNENTKEIKLMSVYGNTMMKSDGKDIRMKDAYAKGGAEKAIAVLNETLKLDIEKYVSVNFKAMIETIDLLGGIEIDVKKDEVPHINGYEKEMAKMLNKKSKEVKKEGKQVLDGKQAVAYCRIRVTDGGDVKRGSRQQEVIAQMLNKLKDAKFAQMDKIMDAVFPQVETNFDNKDMIAYGKDAASYTVKTIPAFPREIKEQVRNKEDKKIQFTDYKEIVEAVNMEKDVQDVQKELFE